MPTDTLPASGEFWSALRARHPGFRASVRADASVNALYRGERHEFRSGLDAALQCVDAGEDHIERGRARTPRCPLGSAHRVLERVRHLLGNPVADHAAQPLQRMEAAQQLVEWWGRRAVRRRVLEGEEHATRRAEVLVALRVVVLDELIEE